MQTGSKEWHAERALGIGGSDAAAALGLSKWKSPYALYLEKTGEAEPKPSNWNMERGKALEPIMRQHFANTFGVEVRLPKSAIVSDEYPWMRCNPDGLTDDKVLCEFKAPGTQEGWGMPGTDEIPIDYLVQVQHNLIVLNWEVARPSASFGGREPVYFDVPLDKELKELIIEGEREFWQRVQDRNPPEPRTAEDVAKRFSVAKEGRVVATEEVLCPLNLLKRRKQEIAVLESDVEMCQTEIKKFMGEFDTLVHETGATLATWKGAKGADRIDSKRLKAEQPAIAAQYTTIGEATRRLLIK